MGINMEVKLVVGVKFDKLPANLVDDGEFTCDNTHHCSKLSHYSDCYCGEWDILGIELESSQDNRYDSQDFFWNISKYNSMVATVKEELMKIGVTADPYIMCFTYYT